MIKLSDIKKLENYRKGVANNEEKKQVYSLFANNEEKDEFRQIIKKDFNEYCDNNEDIDFGLSHLLDKIHHIIHINEYRQKPKVMHKIYRWYATAAAILLIPILILGGIWFSQNNNQKNLVVESSVKSTLIAPLGSRINFSLPDGTKGWLNSGSSLDYSLPFTANRKVALTGEAWFDVAHDEANPFEITAGNSKVEVMGTKFNLNAYPEEKYVEVVLEEGKVKFTTAKLSSGVVMKPNDRLVYNNEAIKIEQTDAEKYGAWKEGKLMFRGDPMPEVARRIERWYNVKIELVDKELENYVIRGTFQDDSLEEVLKYLKMTSPIRYKIIDGGQLDVDGSVQKKKILIYQRLI